MEWVYKHAGVGIPSQAKIIFLRNNELAILIDPYGDPETSADYAKLAEEYSREFLERQSFDAESTMPFLYRDYLSETNNLLFNLVYLLNEKIYRENMTRPLSKRAGLSFGALRNFQGHLSLVAVGSVFLKISALDAPFDFICPHSLNSLLSDRSVESVPWIGLGAQKDIEPHFMEQKVKGDTVVGLSNFYVTLPASVTTANFFSELKSYSQAWAGDADRTGLFFQI